jgi:hypothetical protein
VVVHPAGKSFLTVALHGSGSHGDDHDFPAIAAGFSSTNLSRHFVSA